VSFGDLTGCGSKRPAPPVPIVAVWRPVVVGPEAGDAGETFDFPEGRLTVDESGTRWLFPEAPAGTAAEPTTTTTSDDDPIRLRIEDAREGLLAITLDGRLLATKTALGPLQPLITSRLPAGFEPSSLRRYRGATTVRTPSGLFWSADGSAFVAVPSLPDHAPMEAILDSRGTGIGLFVPERVATTRDAGATWTPVALPGAHTSRLVVQDDQILTLPGGERDGFARQIDAETGAVARGVLRSAGPPRSPSRGWSVAGGPRVDRTSRLEQLARTKPSPPRLLPARGAAGLRGLNDGASFDGDEVLVFDDAPARGRPQRLTRASRGRLGEALVPLGSDVLSTCHVRASAMCGEHVAIVCGARLHLFRGGDHLDSVNTSSDAVIAFDATGRLWSAVPAVPENDSAPAGVRLERHAAGGL
jgi:hypothetical protein